MFHVNEAEELPRHAGPESSTPPTQLMALQLVPEYTCIQLSQIVEHSEAVTDCPLPVNTYHTPGFVTLPLQLLVNPSPSPVFVALTVEPARVWPHAIGCALQIRSLGGAGTGAQAAHLHRTVCEVEFVPQFGVCKYTLTAPVNGAVQRILGWSPHTLSLKHSIVLDRSSAKVSTMSGVGLTAPSAVHNDHSY